MKDDRSTYYTILKRENYCIQNNNYNAQEKEVCRRRREGTIKDITSKTRNINES